ncbi:hypothetical protein RhiTH_009404 [Rhizoctonia solani]
MMPSARTPPTSDQYSSLHEVPSPPPQIQVPVAGPGFNGSAPLTPEPQNMSQASIDEMHRVHDIEHESQDRTNPNNNTHERRHIQPISHSDNAGVSDPWSPSYQRNPNRFSLGASSGKLTVATSYVSGNSEPSHPRGPLYAHHRHRSASPDAPVRIRRKAPGLSNFFRKLNGERVRERGHKVPGFWQSLKAIMLCSLSFIAIIPLENLSEYGGEQLALYCGESIGDLIVITLHNTVEAVLAIVLLVKCELKLLQSTVIGVVLLHCLLVPGVAFLTDGTKLWAQQLKPRITELNQSLLTIGVLSLVVPTAFFSALPYEHPEQYAPQFINETRIATRPGSAPTRRDLLSTNLLDLNKRVLFTPPTHNASIYAIQVASTVDAVSDLTRDWLLRLSRGISIILLLVYVGSRIYLHNPPGEHIVVETVHTTAEDDHVEKGHAVVYSELTPRDPFNPMHTFKRPFRKPHSKEDMEEDRERLISQVEHEHGASEFIDEGSNKHQHPPEVNPWVAILLLIIIIGLLSITAEWGLDHFEIVVVVGASFLVNSITQDGRTNWSEGLIMVGFYVIIALAAWYYPGHAEAHFLLQCKSMQELLSNPPF